MTATATVELAAAGAMIVALLEDACGQTFRPCGIA
jgi:hypothetical protein